MQQCAKGNASSASKKWLAKDLKPGIDNSTRFKARLTDVHVQL